LRTWLQDASGLGIRPQYEGALRALTQNLANRPLEWGDPQYRLRHMKLLVLHRLEPLFQAHYAVDEERRIVYLMQVSPRPGSPLDRGP
jgi:hypothetical protein